MVTQTNPMLPQELADIQLEMEACATAYGLDYFPTIFEVVDVHQLNAIAAYGGFPTRYPHWRFGMSYERLQKGYAYGLQKIYELVINNDPCYAYLLNSNSMTDHRMVIAHVYGHCDFFKNNYWFSKTNRKMIDEMANHGNRIRRHMDRLGVEAVENFIDYCLSLEDLIDIHLPFIQRSPASKSAEPKSQLRSDADTDRNGSVGDPAGGKNSTSEVGYQPRSYMRSFINRRPAPKSESALSDNAVVAPPLPTFPSEPVRDVLGFLLGHAPLEPWQRDVLSIVREEAYYFAPQAQTKIMNEGWATYWHTTIMTRHGLATGGNVIDYADHTSGTLASSPQRLNPYKLGIELFRDIEDRWNRGRYGRDFDDCDDMVARREWNTHAGKGREKIFEVRTIHNDLTFVDEFLTLDFCKRNKMFQFGFNRDSGNYEIESRQFEAVKQQLLFSLTNLGRPIIRVRDANYKNRGELYLEHEFCGPELKISTARDTLENLHRLWKRPVHIESVLEDTKTTLSFDGAEHKTTRHRAPKSDQNAEHPAD